MIYCKHCIRVKQKHAFLLIAQKSILLNILEILYLEYNFANSDDFFMYQVDVKSKGLY